MGDMQDTRISKPVPPRSSSVLTCGPSGASWPALAALPVQQTAQGGLHELGAEQVPPQAQEQQQQALAQTS